MDDIKHLWWLFRNMCKRACIGDWHEAREAAYWIWIHLRYESKKLTDEEANALQKHNLT